MSASNKAPLARDRCEVCSRVITQRPNPRKRRCRDHVEVAALFPLSACKKPKRAKGSQRSDGGER
jgi:hypothetical protein